MKQKSLFFIIGFFWAQQIFSQPIVIVKGSQDSLAWRTEIMQYLDFLDISGKVHLTVNFTPALYDNMGGLTFCLNAPDPDTYQIIRVRIDARLNKQQQSRVLAHEMIHVKQFVKGELVMINSQQVKWKGRKFWCQKRDQQSAPWEREAYQMGNILTDLDKVPPERSLTAVDRNH